MIAEAFAVGGGVHSTGAAAVGNTTVARIPARVLRREASETPSLALALLSEAQKKTAILMDVIESLKVQSADERVSRYILSLCPRGPTSCAIRFPYHKRVVAELLGIQQATLSRSLARLRALGVATDARVISVASVPRLRASLSGAGARAMDAEQRPVEHA
jgi:CRP-like cAMP-binding protein